MKEIKAKVERNCMKRTKVEIKKVNIKAPLRHIWEFWTYEKDYGWTEEEIIEFGNFLAGSKRAKSMEKRYPGACLRVVHFVLE